MDTYHLNGKHLKQFIDFIRDPKNYFDFSREEAIEKSCIAPDRVKPAIETVKATISQILPRLAHEYEKFAKVGSGLTNTQIVLQIPCDSILPEYTEARIVRPPGGGIQFFSSVSDPKDNPEKFFFEHSIIIGIAYYLKQTVLSFFEQQVLGDGYPYAAALHDKYINEDRPISPGTVYTRHITGQQPTFPRIMYLDKISLLVKIIDSKGIDSKGIIAATLEKILGCKTDRLFASDQTLAQFLIHFKRPQINFTESQTTQMFFNTVREQYSRAIVIEIQKEAKDEIVTLADKLKATLPRELGI